MSKVSNGYENKDLNQDAEVENSEQLDEETTDKKVLAEDERVIELTHQLTRLQADFKNYKMRSEREKQDYIQYGIKRLAVDLLPVLDNFERALNEDNIDEESSYYKGVKMIYDQIIDVFKQQNIEVMETVGEPFDPEIHHAVVMEESDEFESNLVIEELQKGYKLNENIIRPAMVKVSK